MQKKLFLQISDYLKRKRRHRLWTKIVICLSCMVVFGTVYALILPAITLEKETLPELICTVESLNLHSHTKQCYDKEDNLICGYADFVVHTHEESCYDEDKNLVCPLPEIEEHTHSYECYEPGKAAVIAEAHTHTGECYTKKKGKLLCGQEESEGHTHSEACYTKEQGELLCGQEESEGHTHGEDCYDEEGNVLCGQEESEGHIHEESCYSIEESLDCGLEESEEHTHTDECYEWENVLTCKKEEQEEQVEELKPVLVCGQEECEAHIHTEECYQETDVLTCKQEESEEHTHGDDCYKTENQLICGKEETEGHEHTEGCYMLGAELTCKKKEIILHTHSEECYDAENKIICGKLEITEHIHGDNCFAVVKEEDKGENENTPEIKADKNTDRHLETDVGFATITADYEEGVLPEGVVLEALEYGEDSDEYNILGQEISESLKDGRTLGSIHPYEIHFVDSDGKEIAPEGTVTIQVTYAKPIQEMGEKPSQWAVFHKTDIGISKLSTDDETLDGGIEELKEASVDCKQTEDGKRTVTGFTFQTNRFSDFILAELSEIETLDVGNPTQIGKFRLWLKAWRENSYENAYMMGGDGINDALKYTDENNETYYLIPIKYFIDNLKEYGYEFDETKPGKCPFVYAPNALYANQNLTSASYVEVENQWYVRVQDKGTYPNSNPEIPRSNIYYRNYEIVKNTKSHPGTVINLFDYWITGQNDADYERPYKSEHFTMGINSNHAFKFSSERVPVNSTTDGKWNVWTGKNNSVYQGIVKNRLVDGYPSLSGNSTVFTPSPNELTNIEDTVDTNESLSYLFDPNVENPYRETYRNVGGLLQTDEEGYYYYNSQKNFAEYNEDTNRFTLYNTWGVMAGGSSPNGQFFPFNAMQEVVQAKSTDNAINHYFGMTLTTRFIQRYNGYTTMSHTTPTTFQFAGDDDVWIFIDGVLVADLGGIHDKASVTIDFSTGDITIDESRKTTLRESFQATLGEGEELDEEDWNGNTFANNTTHTMKFFYLERGNTDSNLFLKYNLTEIPATSIYKVNQYGDAINGATFAVYASNNQWEYLLDDTNEYIDLSQHPYTINPKNGKITITDGKYKDKTISQRYLGTTNSAGEMVFVDDDEMPYTLKELQNRFGGTHFILREVDVPEGYRLVSDEIRLYVANDVLFCDNTYDSGVWASPNLLVTATDSIYPYLRQRQPIDYYHPDTGETKGTLFAVVFKYTGESLIDENGNPVDGYEGLLAKKANWAPIYGSDMRGYTVIKKDNLLEAVIEAATKAKEYGDVVFSQSASGSMQLEIDNLPGNIQNYYYMLDNDDKSQTQYTVSYYWTEGSLENATVFNTYRINADAGTGANPIEGAYDFDRDFGATIAVPNLTNRLFVQKLDEDGRTLVNNAVFALYAVVENTSGIQYVDENGSFVSLNEKKYTVNQETGVITLIEDDEKEGAKIKPVALEKTCSISNKAKNPSGEEGTATFTNLLEGKYYLREISAPSGYEMNETEVMVLVTDDAIYANAGTEDDGVTVARGPGYVVSTMEQFASEGEIDNTLSWVYEKLLVSEKCDSFKDMGIPLDDNGNLSNNWSYLAANYNPELTKDAEAALTTYLKYDVNENANTLFNYTLNDDWYTQNHQSIEGVTRRLYTSVGWSYYLLYQDFEYGTKAAAKGATYNDLREYGDISNLFSRSTYVQVTDRHKVGNLEISKKVKNAPKTEQSEFKFNVRLYKTETIKTKNEETGEEETKILEKNLDGPYTYKVYNVTYETVTDDETGEEIRKEKRTPAKEDFLENGTGTLVLKDGTGTISLKDGQVAVIEDLPAGIHYIVTEEENSADVTTAVRDAGKKQTSNAATGEEHYEYEPGSNLAVHGVLYWNIDEDGKFDGTSTVDYTNTYLPDLSILKYETGSSPTKTLSNAKFLLYYTVKTQEDGADTVSTNYYYSYDEDSKTTSWEAATEDEAKQNYLLTSGDDGRITLHKIPDGVYTLKEVEAPAGYNRMTEDITFTVSGGVITKYTPNQTIAASDDGLTLKVPNSAGYELPHTGGPGTYLYRFSGFLLSAGAIIYGCMMSRKRERKLRK